MLRINAVKLEINTVAGLFGAELNFTTGLNIIRGDNTTGKSSVFRSILYGLGLEELLGGKNASVMPYVFREHVEYEGSEYKVTQSFIYLEFSNGESTVTTKRSIVCEGRMPQLVEVIMGEYLTENGEYEIKSMWVHDAGGASNEDYGFHLFLQEFIGWDLPEVMNSRGEESQLYMQQIAPTFIIEQFAGWTDFLATMPYYNLRNAEGRSIEFLLNLDVAENEKSKRYIQIQKRIIEEKWNSLFDRAKTYAQKGAAILKGIDSKPSILNDIGNISLSIIKDDISYSLIDYIEELKEEHNKLESSQMPTVGQNLNRNERLLGKYTEQYNSFSLQVDVFSPQINLDKSRLKNYQKQLSEISDDLRRNKDILKLNTLGASINMPTAKNLCPICKTDIRNLSLLPEEVKETPMQLEENISYLEAQKKMVEVYIEGQKKLIQDKESRLDLMLGRISELRQLIRNTKKELIADDRLPSEVEIEKRLNIKHKIDFYTKLIDDFDELKKEILFLSKDWEKLKSKEASLPTDFFSSEDRKKLSDLNSKFSYLLNTFGYTSQSGSRIKISLENYLPVIETRINEEKTKQYTIKYDSSGSDFVRAIWAYTCALKKVGDAYATNHPNLLILDEPQQQSAAIDAFKSLLIELSHYDGQVLIFASFNNSDEDYSNSVQGVHNFNLNRIDSKIVKPTKMLL